MECRGCCGVEGVSWMSSIHTYTQYTHTYINAYIHIYMDVSVAEWLAWLTSNCGRIGAIGSSPSNGLRPNK